MRNSLRNVIAVAVLIGVSPFAAHAGLSIGEDLNLDFSKEIQSIEKINDSAAPMQKHLSKGLTELRTLISDVKANPNALSKAKFEVSFATHIQTLVEDMDDVLENRQEIQWALTDIGGKVKTVTKRLAYNNIKMEEKVSRAAEKHEATKKKLVKMAKDIKRSGKNVDPKIVREFKALDRKYKHSLRTQQANTKIKKMLHRTLTALTKNGLMFTQSTEDMDDWFSNLKDQRDSFLKLAEARNDMQKLNQLMTQGGASSVISTFKKLGGINKQMGDFLNAFEAMEGDLDALNSFDATYMDPNETETTGLSSEVALTRRISELLGE